eukprot:scaffold242265_cov21-Tisochrysis_lutea.AAC.3
MAPIFVQDRPKSFPVQCILSFMKDTSKDSLKASQSMCMSLSLKDLPKVSQFHDVACNDHRAEDKGFKDHRRVLEAPCIAVCKAMPCTDNNRAVAGKGNILPKVERSRSGTGISAGAGGNRRQRIHIKALPLMARPGRGDWVDLFPG